MNWYEIILLIIIGNILSYPIVLFLRKLSNGIISWYNEKRGIVEEEIIYTYEPKKGFRPVALKTDIKEIERTNV